MTKPINTISIEKATHKSWEQWVKELDESGAQKLTHTELARKLYDLLDGSVDNHGWWAQGITVAYEQHTGKRVPGQLANGLFELAISKTTTMPRDVLFQKVVSWFEEQSKLNGFELTKPRSSETPKRSTWRCDLADGSKFSATVEDSGEKARLVLSHTAIPTQSEAEEWRMYWRSIANTLGVN